MQVTKNDLNVLNNYNFIESNNLKNSKCYNRKNNKHLLGVRKGSLISVESKDITCWNLFLRIFGLGALAHTHISLKMLVKHLEKYDWKNLTENEQALVNMRKIANSDFAKKCLFFKPKNSKLLKENSQLIHTIHGRFYLSRSTTARDFYKQMPFYMHLFRVDENGVETPVLPTELINSKAAADAICVRNKQTGVFSTRLNPYPHMCHIDLVYPLL